MTLTLEFVGGPLDGERKDLPHGAQVWRHALPIPAGSNPTPLVAPRQREGLYRRVTYRQGERAGDRVFIVDTDVMRWEGE